MVYINSTDNVMAHDGSGDSCVYKFILGWLGHSLDLKDKPVIIVAESFHLQRALLPPPLWRNG